MVWLWGIVFFDALNHHGRAMMMVSIALIGATAVRFAGGCVIVAEFVLWRPIVDFGGNTTI